jgi:hypothetical protein
LGIHYIIVSSISLHWSSTTDKHLLQVCLCHVNCTTWHLHEPLISIKIFNFFKVLLNNDINCWHYIASMIDESAWRIIRITLTGKNRGAQTKSCHSVTLYTTITHRLA